MSKVFGESATHDAADEAGGKVEVAAGGAGPVARACLQAGGVELLEGGVLVGVVVEGDHLRRREAETALDLRIRE